MLTLVLPSGEMEADFVFCVCVFQIFCLNMYCFVIRKTSGPNILKEEMFNVSMNKFSVAVQYKVGNPNTPKVA